MSHLQILTCPVQTILKNLTETQNLYSQLITLVKMSSQDIYNIYTVPTKLLGNWYSDYFLRHGQINFLFNRTIYPLALEVTDYHHPKLLEISNF